jgi:homoserine dehydrogenase
MKSADALSGGVVLNPVKVGICGLGTVGSGTYNVLTRNRDVISARAGCRIEIAQIGARRDNPNCPVSGIPVTRDIFEVADNPDVQIVAELIGGTTTARELVLRAIDNGKHVVTANKALIAQHGNEIFAAAQARGVSVAFEAAVAGGIPVIKAIREGLAANRIEWLAGIINGTSNFILSEMRDKGRSFADVLAEAQALGYAEADPTFDVEGIDAGHKLMILASIAFGIPLQFNSMYTEGITRITPVDVQFAEQLGYRIKLLGIARRVDKGIELRVHPTLIPEKRLIANVNGVMNAVLVKGDAVGPTLYYGAGAGSEATASSVIADIIDVARTLNADPSHRVPYLAFQSNALDSTPVLSIDQVVSAYYLRISALDRPGVLSRVAQILSDAGISIEALIQKEPMEGQDHVPVIILTNRTEERRLMGAVGQIEALDSIDGDVVRIRVESLAG